MKIMIDTNVLISSLVFGGMPKQLIGKLLLMGHDLYISDYVYQEFTDKLHLKWPQKESRLLQIYHDMDFIYRYHDSGRLSE